MSCQLSKDLRKKYGKKHVRVVEGDSVKVIRGEFTGVDGKVTEVSAANNGLTIEGVKKEKLKGEKYDVYIHTSNIEVTGLNTDDKWRMNKLEGKDVREPRSESVKKDEPVKKELKAEEESPKKEKTTSKVEEKKSVERKKGEEK